MLQNRHGVTSSIDLDSHEARSLRRRQSIAATRVPPHFDPGRRRSLIPSLENSVSHFLSSHQKTARIHGLTDEAWKSLQNSISGIFRHEKVDPTELYELHKMIQTVLKSELSTFLAEYYKTHLLKKGMQYLLEVILSKGDGDILLHALANLWVKFLSTMLPQIQAILISVQTTELTIRQMTLVGFRDAIVLDVNIVDAVIAGANIEAEITQMLLVLQHVHDCRPPSRNYLRLEELVARVISPYIGTRGLYIGGKIKTPRRYSSEARSDQAELTSPRNGIFPRLFPRSVSHDEYNNNDETNKDSNNRVIFSIDDESEDELSDNDIHADDDDDDDDVSKNSRLSNLRRGTVSVLPLTKHHSEEDLQEDDTVCPDPDHSGCPPTLSPLPYSTPDFQNPYFVRNARRASLPLPAKNPSILKTPSATIDAKRNRKNKLRMLFSHKKSKSVHYA